MAKKELKKIKNKNKRSDIKTQELGEFMQDHGIEQKNVIEVVTESGSTKIIDVGNIPLAPKAHFEQVIDPELLRKGPPFNIIVRNVNYDSNVDEVIDYFNGISLNPQNKTSNDFSGVGGNSGHRRGEFLFTVNTEDDLRAALAKDGTRMNNREIVVEILSSTARLHERGNYFNSYKQQNISRYKRMMNDGNGENADEIDDWKVGRDRFSMQQNQKPFSRGQRPNKFDTGGFNVDGAFDSDWRTARNEFQSNKSHDSRGIAHQNRSYSKEGQDDTNLPNNWINAKLEFQKERPSHPNQSASTEDISLPNDWKTAKEDFQRQLNNTQPKHNSNYINKRSNSPSGNPANRQKKISSTNSNHNMNDDLMTIDWISKKNEFQQSQPMTNNQKPIKKENASSHNYNLKKNKNKLRQNFNNNEGRNFNQRPDKKPTQSSIIQDENGLWLKHPGV